MKKIIYMVLVIFLILTVGVIVYTTLFSQTISVKFELNGADSITQNTVTCQKRIKGCYIKLPDLKRNDGTVLGYSLNKNSQKADYQVGEKMYVTKDVMVYGISYKKVSVHIEKNNVDYLEKDSISCNAYNNSASCKIKMPKFNKVGYQNAGYSLVKNSLENVPGDYFPLEEYELSKDLTLYPKYSDDRRGYAFVYNTEVIHEVNGTFVEIEKGSANRNTYVNILDEISKKAPYLFNGTKITFLSGSTLDNVWLVRIDGVNYGSSVEGHPLSRSIDIRDDFNNKYFTIVHEMVHSLDYYYSYKSKGKITGLFDVGREAHNGLSIEGDISSEDDMVKIYNYYKIMDKSLRPFRDYSYNAKDEFFADAYTYYYLKYIVPTAGYKELDYPDAIRNVIEKYICIASNNYKKDLC